MMFIAGCFVGAFIGLVVMALCCAAKLGDQRACDREE